MVGGNDFLWFSQLDESPVVPDLEAGEVEGVVAELNPFSTQIGGYGVAIALEGDGRGLVDVALSAVKEGLTQAVRIRRTGSRGRILPEAFERGLTSLGVELALGRRPVDDLEPGQERLVELAQGGDGGFGEFGQ